MKELNNAKYAECHYAECHLRPVPFLLNVTNKPIKLSAIMLNVVAPFENTAWGHECKGWGNSFCSSCNLRV
jgi:hypothetical protein